jgi:hypothetical protein
VIVPAILFAVGAYDIFAQVTLFGFGATERPQVTPSYRLTGAAAVANGSALWFLALALMVYFICHRKPEEWKPYRIIGHALMVFFVASLLLAHFVLRFFGNTYD